MISIIICSRNNDISNEQKNNIQETIGVDYQLIVVDNSKNTYSITKAYNYGIKESKFNILCFVHEDVFFITKHWGNIIIKHLSEIERGIIGVAGGKYVSKCPSSWSEIKALQRKSFYQNGIIQLNREYSSDKSRVVLLDGFFMATNKKFISEFLFDEDIPGFHCYDIDCSLSSIFNKGSNYVIYDMMMNHISQGYKSREWVLSSEFVFKKWKNYLPINVSNENIDVNKVQRSALLRFLKLMIRRHFSINEILSDRFLKDLWKDCYTNSLGLYIRIFAYKILHIFRFL